jgi:hypothetical protein
MKVRLQMMIQDPRFAPVEGAKRRIEGYDVSTEEFSDGPATKRVAMVDLDANTGQPVAGARFVPPKPGRVLGRFDLPPKSEQIDITSRTFNQVSVMATVLKTIAMYEDADVLGRPVHWNFADRQLKVVPRMGLQENAYYNRNSRRLEFYYFQDHVKGNETVFTSLSRDIVAHETGHAILDGIAPHLLDAPTPQSLALHEAIGDITGLLIAISSPGLRVEVLAKTKGSIANANYFSAIAEQFGMARGTGALRDLRNDKKISDVDRSEPHSLSEVLTGALYSVLIKMHNKRWDAYSGESDAAAKRYSNSGKALWDSAQQFKRMTLRALDYLPPGEVSFADYARAIIAADQASHPDDAEERGWLKEEFVARGIVSDEQALDVTVPDPDFAGVDLDALLKDDGAARSFAGQHRDLLRIPVGSQFTVGPRLKVTKKYYHRAEGQAKYSEATVTECLLKVWWSDPKRPASRAGTTLAIDWTTRRLCVLLTSDRSDRPKEAQEQQADRARSAGLRPRIACCKE